jgi:predicted ATPase/transcriptional regulator with XRE-family HTH domain
VETTPRIPADIDRRTFGSLLRDLRYRAGLTQEALADRAGIGQRSLQYLESDQSRPQRATIDRLVAALDLSDRERADFERAAPFASRGATRSARHQESSPPQGLPRPRTSFIGRGVELAAAADMVRRSPLVTVAGPGGVGKTRLAVELATRVTDDVVGQVWFVSLASASGPSMVVEAVARTLGLIEGHQRSARDAVFRRLRDDRVLVILDNCEQVIAEVAAFVHELLTECSAVTVMTTSREPLGISGELVLRLGPLPVPDQRLTCQPEELLEYEAARLFVERAPRPLPLTPAACTAITDVCLRVDGLPLALELAAARLATLSPEQIVDRLDDRFRLLTSTGRQIEARHQTLRNLIDWSYDLLDDAEQWLLRAIATFPDGFTLTAAEVITSGVGRDPGAVMELLDALVAKSLLLIDHSGSVPRYRLFESVREYARQQRDRACETPSLSAAHAAWALDLAETARAASEGPEQRSWLDRIDSERDSARAALEWLIDHDRDVALRLCVAMSWLWRHRGPVSDGRRWLDLALAQESPPGPLKVEALTAAADLADRSGDVERAAVLGREAVASAREIGAEPLAARALLILSSVAVHRGESEAARELTATSLSLARRSQRRWDLVWGLVRQVDWEHLPRQDFDRSRAHLEEALAIAYESGNPLLQELALGTLGELTLEEGRPHEALPLLIEAVDLATVSGDPREIAYTSYVLGLGRALVEDYDGAYEAFHQGIACAGEHGDDEYEAINIAGLAQLELALGNPESAREHALDALTVMSSFGTVFWLADCLIVLARSLTACGSPDVAARLFASAEVTEPTASFAAHFGWDDRAARVGRAELRRALGADRFEAAWRAGRQMSPEAVVPYALAAGSRVVARNAE